MWASGSFDARWYCLDCWAAYHNVSVAEVPAKLGWSVRDKKRKAFAESLKRTPKNIGGDDERFSHKDKKTRMIFCDQLGCRKPFQGVDAGYFLQQNLPMVKYRYDMWLRGELDMTWYCRDCYFKVTGRLEPVGADERRKGRQLHRQFDERARKREQRTEKQWSSERW